MPDDAQRGHGELPGGARAAGTHPRLQTYADRSCAALSFAIEIGRADGSAVAALVVPVGYQELPLAGDLPERPAKPLQRAALKARIADRQLIETTRVPSSCLDVLKRDELRDKFPAVATWMLPGDLAIIYHVSIGDKWPRWITRDACAVVRIRGRRASIVGGNVLDVLVPPPADTTAPPSDD